MKEFYIVEVGPGLYVEAMSSIFHRATTHDLLRAKLIRTYDQAASIARQYNGKIIEYTMHPIGEETEEIYILRKAIRQMRSEMAAHGLSEDAEESKESEQSGY